MAPCSKRALGAAVALSPEKASKARKIEAIINGEAKPKSPHVARLESALVALRPGYPKGRVMPCRAPERKKILGHLRSAVDAGGSSQVLYVSGMPGTGKTAVFFEALHQLKSQCKFSLVHVNAMRLSAPVQVFREIADQLSCQTNNSQAKGNVTDYFMARTEEDPVVVLLIDEVDCLATPTQAVLYKVFDWLGMPNARLVLAAISNTMDLPERLLPRVASRLHIARVDFAAYDKAQIYDILCNRLKGQNAQDAFGDISSATGSMVLRLCAARVAGASGDIRKALQICRRAVEVRLQAAGPEGPVHLANLQEAEKALVLGNPLCEAIMGQSTKTRHFLSAILIELKRKEGTRVSLWKASSRFQKICAMTTLESERGADPTCNAALDPMSAAELEGSVGLLAGRLQAMGILNIQVPSPSTELGSGGPAVSLESLDIQDLETTLLKLEDDPAVRELIEGGSLGAEQARTFTKID